MTQLTQRYGEALTLAHALHAGQTRKHKAVPYIAHPLALSGLVSEFGGDEDEAIAGLLHDTVEDCGGPPVIARIRDQFGARVAGIVEGCTDTSVEPELSCKEEIAVSPFGLLAMTRLDAGETPALRGERHCEAFRPKQSCGLRLPRRLSGSSQ